MSSAVLIGRGISETAGSRALKGNSLARWRHSAGSSRWEDMAAGWHLAPTHSILLH